MCWATTKQRQKCLNCSSSSGQNESNKNQRSTNNNCAPSNKTNSATDFL
ncbi:uncharacterized protein LOC110188992 [Drosophila serrata]|nr:uncharacterized protein LOC110188992 [Drosophila serrata]